MRRFPPAAIELGVFFHSPIGVAATGVIRTGAGTRAGARAAGGSLPQDHPSRVLAGIGALRAKVVAIQGESAANVHAVISPIIGPGGYGPIIAVCTRLKNLHHAKTQNLRRSC